MSKKNGILDLVVTKQWFEKIKSGEKTHEYRNFQKWKRLLANDNHYHYNIIRFRNGQTVKSTDVKKVLYGEIHSVSVVQGINTDLKCRGPVFDIEFKLLGDADSVNLVCD